MAGNLSYPNKTSISNGSKPISIYNLGSVYQTELYIWAGVSLPILYLGAFGNILTIAVIVRARWWKSSIQVLIASLTMAGLCATVVVHPLQLLNYMFAARYPFSNMSYCRTTGYLTMIVYYLQPLHCCMIALNRFTTIVLPTRFKVLTSQMAGVVMAIYCWALPCVLFAFPLAGVDGKFVQGRPFGQCSWGGYLGSRALSYLVTFGSVYVPTIVIFFCYLLIFIYLRHGDHRVTHQVAANLTANDDPNHQVEVARRKRDRMHRRVQVAKMMGVTFLVFLVCWVPLTSFFYIVRDPSQAPYPAVLLALILVFWLSDCCNTVIYLVMNQDFRDAYKELLQLLRNQCLRQRTVRPPTTAGKTQMTSMSEQGQAKRRLENTSFRKTSYM